VRRLAVIAIVLLGAIVLAACGAQGVVSPTPDTVIGTVSSGPVFPKVPAFKLSGDSTKGKAIFTAQCSTCHTLAAAKATGTIGPNLDTLKPDYQAVTAQVTLGPKGPLKGSMPSFQGTLTTQQIADVAAFVVDSTGGKAP
jgi:mono/diheme cytochrome c family protein